KELRLVRAGPGQLLRLLLETAARIDEGLVLFLQRAPLRLHLARLPLGLGEERAELRAIPGHLERDGQRLAHGFEQLRPGAVPRPQAGQLEDARNLAVVEQWDERDRLGRSVGEGRGDAKLILRGVDDGNVALKRRLSDEAFAGPEAGGGILRRKRMPSQEPKRSLGIRRVERSYRTLQVL